MCGDIDSPYPKDTELKKDERKGFKIIWKLLNVEHWELRSKTGPDVAVDCELEYIRDNSFQNEIVEVQIKSTSSIVFDKDNNVVFHRFPTKTFFYARRGKRPFIAIVVDLKNEDAYYLRIDNLEPYNDKLVNQSTMTLHIPTQNNLKYNEEILISFLNE